MQEILEHSPTTTSFDKHEIILDNVEKLTLTVANLKIVPEKGFEKDSCFINLTGFNSITHVLNEQGTGYECLKSIGFYWVEKWTLPHERASKPNSDCEIWGWLEKKEVNGGPLKQNPKEESLVWIGGTPVPPTNSRFSKVYHDFAFKLITLKFSKLTTVWMLFPFITWPINALWLTPN